MTGYGDREIIGRAGTRYGTHSLGRTDSLRDFHVGNRLADRNFLQRLPDTSLEGRAADVEGQIESHLRSFDEADDPRDQRFIVLVGADQRGLREAILKLTKESTGIVSEQN
jgi:hypothetical protein